MKSPTLTIGIPTFNRCDLLPQTLDNILAQVVPCRSNRVHILICDNASTDNTKDVVLRYTTLHPKLITYFRNDKNIGFTPNVDKCIQLATTDFVLIMSDDDALEDNAVEDVLNILDKHPDLGLLSLSSTAWNQSLSQQTHKFIPKPDLFCERGVDYVRTTHDFTCILISGYVVNRHGWINLHPKRFFAVNSIQIIMGLLLMGNAPGYFVRSKPHIKYRADMGHWSLASDPLYPFPMFLNYLLCCKVIAQSYPASLVTILYCTTIKTAIGHVIRNKVLGFHFPRKDISKLFTPHLDTHGVRRFLFTFLLKTAIALPRACFYVPFRWLVPEKI